MALVQHVGLAISFVCLSYIFSHYLPHLNVRRPSRPPVTSAARARPPVSYISSASTLPMSRSAKWSPTVITSCTAASARLSAPCLRLPRGAATAYEVSYPDFSLRLPRFIARAAAVEWTRRLALGYGDRLRVDVNSNTAVYAGQAGQVLAFRPGVYSGLPASTWHSPGACMARDVSHNLSLVSSNSSLGNGTVNIVANVPDASSFQHFLDRVAHILVQAEPMVRSLSPKRVRVFLGRRVTRLTPHVRSALAAFYNASIILSTSAALDSSDGMLLHACRAPLVHPYLSLRFVELLALPPPAAARNTVLYMPRRRSRLVRNEGALLGALRGLLAKRGRGEVLVVFDHTRFKDLGDVAKWVRQRARAIVGAHGGALYNHRWAAPLTPLVEMLPYTRFEAMFWEEATVLGLPYWPVIVANNGTQREKQKEKVKETVSGKERNGKEKSKSSRKRRGNGGSFDIIAPVHVVVDTLRAALEGTDSSDATKETSTGTGAGSKDEEEGSVQRYYHWEVQ